MKIAIDISQIIYETGVSVYTRNLVENLLKIDRENEYLLFGGSLRRFGELKDIAESFKGNVSSKIFAYPPAFANLVWNSLHSLPIEKLIGPVDVLHTSDWSEPKSSAFKVTTVHDLYPLKFPKMVQASVREVHKRKLSWVIVESKRVIVPSESTKNDLISIGVDEGRVRVIPEAPSIVKSTEKEIEEAKRKHNIKGEYLISIGITPLKNTERIIKAFHLAKSNKDLKLILIGRPNNLKIEGERNVRILGHVSREDLGPLLTGSKALIYASLYEGFGIPILDGFNCGVPVVTSNISSMPEVAGKAAVLVDPYDVTSISEGIQKAINAPKGLIEKGSEQVKKFSWAKAAEETLKVYNEAKL